MRKLIILLVIITYPAHQLFSQDISSKKSISISVGPSIPMGDYSKSDKNNLTSGYAKTGIGAGISYKYKLNKTIGLEAMGYGQKNSLNTAALAKQLSETDFFEASPQKYQDWTVERKSWMLGSLLIGATGEFPSSHSNKLSFTGKTLFGMAHVISPDIKAESKSENTFAIFTAKYGSNTIPCLIIGGGVQYHLSNRFKLFLNGECFATTKISFKDATEIILATNGGLIIPGLYKIENSREYPLTSGQIGTRKQTIQSININSGLTFNW